jgi:Ribbon-helix-helix protein, copG family
MTPPAPTERWTLHIERPFIARIKAEAEAEHVTVTEVINRIIRHYYEG